MFASYDCKEVGHVSATCPYPKGRARHPTRSTYVKGDQKASSPKQPAGENEEAAADNATGDFCVEDDPNACG